jgi:formate dehydrogenase subunit gamma
MHLRSRYACRRGAAEHMFMSLLSAFRRSFVATIAVLTFIAMASPSIAQQRNPDGAPNPTASVLSQQTLLHQYPRIEGRIDILDPRASVLIQPAGRVWVYFHEVILHWFGTIVIIGMLFLLLIAYLIIGPLRVTGGRSGIKILRFTSFERFAHWLNATSFVILALTGLNITFGKLILLPMIGPDNFTVVSQATKYLHNFVSVAFVIGMLLITVLWVKDNIPRQVDFRWLAEGGGFIKSRHPPAGRFNAGEKLVFWLSLAASVVMIVSGYLLIFPFYLTNIFGMQLAQGAHAIVALLFVALIMGHIYIGTIGTQGAFEAMGEGTVDFNWAREHHSLWLEQMSRMGENPAAQPADTPAE